jgi:hypothetical protein
MEGVDTGDMFGLPSVVDIKEAKCREVSYETAKKIILQYEWLGTMGTTQMHYGIYFDGLCAGVICFGYFQAMNTNNDGGHPYAPYVGSLSDKGIQLSRGATTHWAHEHSGSKLIAYGLQQMAKKGYKYVIAFSDPEAGEIGTLYQATNWYYLGFSNTRHYDIYHKDKRRGLFMNDRDFHKKFGFSGRRQMTEWVQDRPHLIVVERRPKARYIKLLGSKTDKKVMMSVLKPKIKPYPKRE